MKEKKKFRTFEQQIDLLVSRNLKITEKSLLINYLKKYNYQHFINGYNDPFIIGFRRSNNKYLDSATSTAIISLFNFDRDISRLLFSDIIEMERKITTSCAYVIAKEISKVGYNHGLFHELNENEWNNIFMCEYNNNYQVKLFFLKIFMNHRSTKLLRDYYCGDKLKPGEKLDFRKIEWDTFNNGYLDVPIWTYAIFWSFGNLLTLIDMLNMEIKNEIIKIHFSKLFENYSEFKIVFKNLKKIRNIICHHDVLYNFKIKISDKDFKGFLFRNLKIESSSIRLYDVIRLISLINNNPRVLKLFNQKFEKLNNDNYIAKESMSRIKKVMNIK
ncbi:MAG: Abi family protein [Mycoplasmoidaceae bacterium]